jgi:hypothetical protein
MVWFGGHSVVGLALTSVITGVPTTWMIWLAVLVLVQWSVAVQVRVMVTLAQLPAVVASANVSVGLESHTSVAVGVANDGVCEHWIVDSSGNAEITGAVSSATEIVCEAVVLCPQLSVAVHVRVTECSCGQLPAVVTSTNVSVGVLQPPVAVGVANCGIAVHSIVDGGGSAEIASGWEVTVYWMFPQVATMPCGWSLIWTNIFT